MFKETIINYSKNLSALRDFVAYLHPILRDRAEELQGTHGDLAGETFKEFLLLLAKPDAIERIKVSKINFTVSVTAPSNDEAPRPAKAAGPRKTPSPLRSVDSLSPGELEKLIATSEKLQKHFEAMALPQGHLSHLYESSLISLISATEWFLARVLHTIYDKFPGMFESDKAFTISQIKAFGSVENILEDASDAKVESILQKSVEDQLSYFGKAFGPVDLSFTKDVFADLVEIHARRNLLIHNGGTVNKKYLDRIQDSGTLGDLPTIGASLTVDQAYLDRAIDLFENVFVHVTMALWKKLDPQDESRRFLIDHALEQIVAGRYATAWAWSEFTLKDTKLTRAQKLAAKFNYWQALKWGGRFEEVREAIEDEDLSLAPLTYDLAKFALLDDADGFFLLLPRAVADKVLKLSQLKSWPIFRAMRDTDRYENALKQIEESPQSNGKTKGRRPKAKKSPGPPPKAAARKKADARMKIKPRRQSPARKRRS